MEKENIIPTIIMCFIIVVFALAVTSMVSGIPIIADSSICESTNLTKARGLIVSYKCI